MLSDFKLLIGLALILLFALPNNSYAYSNSCHLNNLRVNNFQEHEGNLYIGFENLDDGGGIYYKKGQVLSEKQQRVKDLLVWASKSKDRYFDIEADPYICDTLRDKRGRGSAYFPASLFYSSIKSDANYGCICDITNSTTPTMFMLPTMSEVSDILRHVAGFDEEKIKQFQVGMMDMFANMNPQRSQANTLGLPIIIIEKMALMGVDKITNDEMLYLIGLFQDQLRPDELEFLEDIINQIENIEFKKDSRGRTVVKLNTYDGDIKISSSDIPMNTPQQRAALEKTLHSALIEDGATFKYTNTDGHEGRYKKVEIDGISIKGDFPVIGKLKVSAKRATIDLNNSDIPAMIRVSFKKVVSIPWTFKINH